MNLKNLNIGSSIEDIVDKNRIEMQRICNFLKCTEADVFAMYKSKSLDTEVLLRWSKLLEYDFFRLYSQHLILYSPPSSTEAAQKGKILNSLPVFRKNLYTMEMIEFILEKISNGEMTKSQVITEYRIPKTTLYKWVQKYRSVDK
ncbi:hypothetical protein CLU97_1400 [Chryseobacterium sp. 7]|uniref:transposase n=1 Tax=Chryseobacterium sp. 7 TaxID=2035214 RepID=UPI000EB3FAEA|nr:transposase [Chryseobacterium sp. 7]RLJ31959.1 hypothetical protein CLU97_1400 [Chryseobacterium sp. 7]